MTLISLDDWFRARCAVRMNMNLHKMVSINKYLVSFFGKCHQYCFFFLLISIEKYLDSPQFCVYCYLATILSSLHVNNYLSIFCKISFEIGKFPRQFRGLLWMIRIFKVCKKALELFIICLKMTMCKNKVKNFFTVTEELKRLESTSNLRPKDLQWRRRKVFSVSTQIASSSLNLCYESSLFAAWTPNHTKRLGGTCKSRIRISVDFLVQTVSLLEMCWKIKVIRWTTWKIRNELPKFGNVGIAKVYQ